MSSLPKYIAVILALLACFCLGRRYEKGHNPPLEVLKVDTLVLTQDVFIDRPMPVKTTIVDTVRIPVVKTETIHDTTYVIVGMESKVYEDSLYTAWVSGYRPSLDSIVIHQVNRYYPVYIEQKAERDRFNIGVSGGYGVSKDGLSPFIGITFGYTLFSF